MRSTIQHARRRIALLFVIGSLLPLTVHAQGLGFAGGLNFDQLSDIEGNRTATFDNATGYHVGLFYTFNVGMLGIRPGVFYVDVGEFEIDFEDNRPCTVVGGCEDLFDLSLIEIPIDVRLRLNTPVLTPYLLAGPTLRFANTSNEDLEDALKEFSVAAAIGAGLEIGPPGGNLRFYPEIRYNFGVDGVIDDFTFLGAEFEADEEQQLNSIMLRLGLTF